jgi:4'-phosphopantetheinyl transferase
MRIGRGAWSTDFTGPGEVHTWLVDLDEPFGATAPAGRPASAGGADLMLAPAERVRRDSYVRAQDGTRFAASRAWLRLLLSRYLDGEPADLRFAATSDGRPGLAEHDANRIHFSLSRSAGRALVAVSPSPVGADVELVNARAGLADLVAGRFAAAEAACIAEGCGGSQLRGFYRHWTAKEAYLKATGRGIRDLRGTELVCGPRPAIQFGGRLATGWTLSLMEPASGCSAAVVGSGPVTRCAAARW